MKENGENSPEPQEIQLEQTFLPFREMPDLPQGGLDEDDYQYLFEHSFVFKSVSSLISIHSICTFLRPDNFFIFPTTPLGKVGVKRSFENGTFNTQELPVSLFLRTFFPTVQKYEEFQRYAIEVGIGGSNYYLKLGGEDFHNSMINSIEGGDGATGSGIYDEKGEYTHIALPYDGEVLRDIKATILEKDLQYF